MKKSFTCIILLINTLCQEAQGKNSLQLGSSRSLEQNLIQKLFTENQAALLNSSPVGNITTPQNPIVYNPEQKTKKSNLPLVKATIPKSLFKIELILQDKRSFQGTIHVEDILLTMNHPLNGYIFTKNLYLHDIASIKILKWHLIDATLNKMNTYYFLPIEYLVTSKEKIQFIYSTNIVPLNRFQLDNEFGKAYFYAYFIDYKNHQKWVNLNIKESITTVKKALGSVCTEIIFDPQTVKKNTIKKRKHG